jgi:hypothetical protein
MATGGMGIVGLVEAISAGAKTSALLSSFRGGIGGGSMGWHSTTTGWGVLS